jgi:hypothetical protein
MSDERDKDIMTAKATLVYDLHRTALLNQKYYGQRLARYKRWNLVFEITLALSGSGFLASLALFQGAAESRLWQGLVAVAAILVILKPLLGLAGNIDKYSRLFTVYSELFYELGYISSEIKIAQAYTGEVDRLHRRARARFDSMAREDDPQPSRKFLRRLQQEVNAQLPADRMWVPS